MKASVNPDSTLAYDLLLNPKPLAHSNKKDLEPTTVLLDTGASISLMPLWQAQKLKLEVKKRTDIIVCGADGHPLAIEGVTGLYARNSEAKY